MKIDKIVYINLGRRPERKEWFLSQMALAKVPERIIERVPAMDWQDYPSAAAQLKAMQADGFALNLSEEKVKAEDRGANAYHWSYCRCLRDAVNNWETVLIFQDDVALKMQWDAFERNLSFLPTHIYSGTWVVQFGWWNKEEPDSHRPNVTIPYGDGKDRWQWSNGIRNSGDKAILYTPPAADRMLAMIQGGYNQIYVPDGIIYEAFNNSRGFFPQHPDDFIIKMRSGVSDIHPDKNPSMLSIVDDLEV